LAASDPDQLEANRENRNQDDGDHDQSELVGTTGIFGKIAGEDEDGCPDQGSGHVVDL
jgi:hypothetical protein